MSKSLPEAQDDRDLLSAARESFRELSETIELLGLNESFAIPIPRPARLTRPLSALFVRLALLRKFTVGDDEFRLSKVVNALERLDGAASQEAVLRARNELAAADVFASGVNYGDRALTPKFTPTEVVRQMMYGGVLHGDLEKFANVRDIDWSQRIDIANRWALQVEVLAWNLLQALNRRGEAIGLRPERTVGLPVDELEAWLSARNGR